MAASAAVKMPPLTGTALLGARSSLADVTFGVQAAGAVPPEMATGTVAHAAPPDGHDDDGVDREAEGQGISLAKADGAAQDPTP